MGNLGRGEAKKLFFYASIVACCCLPITILLVLVLLIRKMVHECFRTRNQRVRPQTHVQEREDTIVLDEEVSSMSGIPNLFLMRKMWKEGHVVHIECEWGTQQKDVLLLSYAYAEKRNSDGVYSVEIVIHVGNASEIRESIPASCLLMMEKAWKLFPSSRLWSDRLQTIALPFCEIHEVPPMSRGDMIERMGATYLLGTTVSEAVFNYNENYLRRGWVQQEILNGALIITVAEIQVPEPTLLKKVLSARKDTQTRLGLSLLVAFNDGAEAAEEDWRRRNAEARMDELTEQAIRYIAGLRAVIFRERKERATALELLFLYALLHNGSAKRAKILLVPTDSCLTLAALRADPDTRTLSFKPEYTIIKPLPEALKSALNVTDSDTTALATLPKRALEDLVSLEVYNFRNITTEFTQDADRHKAIYGLIEQAQSRAVAEEEKESYGAMMGAPHSHGFVAVRNASVSASAAMREIFYRVYAYSPSANAFPTLPAGKRLGPRQVAWCYVGSDKYDGALWMVLGAQCSVEGFETLVFSGAYFEYWSMQNTECTLARAAIKPEDIATITAKISVITDPPKQNLEISGLIDLEQGTAEQTQRAVTGVSLMALAKQSFHAGLFGFT